MLLLPSASEAEDAWRKVLETEAKRAHDEVEMVDVEDEQDGKAPQIQVGSILGLSFSR